MFLSIVNEIVPYTYFIVIILFLTSFSFLITFQLFDIFRNELIFYRLKKMNFDNSSVDELFIFLKVLVKKKLWLTAIRLMEARKNISSSNMHQYFNAIGYIYDRMGKYNISILYYLKAISLKKNYIIGLQNLAKIYEKTNSSLALSVYENILEYDSNNKRANQYIRLNS